MRKRSIPKEQKTGRWLMLAVATLSVVVVLQYAGIIPPYQKGRAGMASAGKLTVGWIGPLTGPVDFLGKENIKAIQMAVDGHNASRQHSEPEIELVAQDDRYDPAISIQLYDDMVARYHPAVIFVNTYSAMFPIAKRALRDQVIIINPLDNDKHLSILSPNVFLIAKQSEELGETMAGDILGRSFKKVKITYYSGDDFMPSVAFSLNEALQKAGIEVIMHNYKTLEEATVNEHADLIKKVRPDANVFLGYSETGLLMRRYRDEGISAVFYAINTTAKDTSRGALEGARILQFSADGGSRALVESFLDQYKKTYQADIIQPWTVLQAHDAAGILINAVKKAANQNISMSSLRQQLLQTQNFSGLSGVISIGENGASHGIVWSMYDFRNGKLVKQ